MRHQSKLQGCLLLRVQRTTRRTRGRPEGKETFLLRVNPETRIFVKSRRVSLSLSFPGTNQRSLLVTGEKGMPPEPPRTKQWMRKVLEELSECLLSPRREVTEFPVLRECAEGSDIDDFRHSSVRYVVRRPLS